MSLSLCFPTVLVVSECCTCVFKACTLHVHVLCVCFCVHVAVRVTAAKCSDKCHYACVIYTHTHTHTYTHTRTRTHTRAHTHARKRRRGQARRATQQTPWPRASAGASQAPRCKTDWGTSMPCSAFSAGAPGPFTCALLSCSRRQARARLVVSQVVPSMAHVPLVVRSMAHVPGRLSPPSMGVPAQVRSWMWRRRRWRGRCRR